MRHPPTDLKQMARLLALLADGTRLRILHLLLARELCVCELVDALRMPQYKVSRHLRRLRSVGAVEARRDGRWMHYRVSHQVTADGLHQDLLKLIGRQLRHTPEVGRDEAHLARRLALRRSGQCVVGTSGLCAPGGKARATAGRTALRAASRQGNSRVAHQRATR